MPHQQARDYSTAKITFDVMPNARLLRCAKLYQNIRRKGRAQTRGVINFPGPGRESYLWMTRTSPGRRLADRLALFFFRLATVVLYDSAMPLRVSPFFTLW